MGVRALGLLQGNDRSETSLRLGRRQGPACESGVVSDAPEGASCALEGTRVASEWRQRGSRGASRSLVCVKESEFIGS